MTAETTANPDSTEPDAGQMAADKKARNRAAVKAGANCGFVITLVTSIISITAIGFIFLMGAMEQGDPLTALRMMLMITAVSFPFTLAYLLVGSAVSAVYGAIIGKLVTFADNTLGAMLTGLASAVPMIGLAWLSDGLPQPEEFFSDLFAYTFFSTSCAAASFVAMQSWPDKAGYKSFLTPPWILPIVLLPLLLLSSLIASHDDNNVAVFESSKSTPPLLITHLITYGNEQFDDADLINNIPSLKDHDKLAIDISKTQVTDAGVAHLSELPNLTLLIVGEGLVTDDQISKLREAMPQLDVRRHSESNNHAVPEHDSELSRELLEFFKQKADAQKPEQ